jgi:hypothetical protein
MPPVLLQVLSCEELVFARTTPQQKLMIVNQLQVSAYLYCLTPSKPRKFKPTALFLLDVRQPSVGLLVGLGP